MKYFFTVGVFIMLTSGYLHAQPCVNPTITSPRMNVFIQNSILFCDNNDTEVLTTQTFDTYQWYRQQWSARPGPNTNPWVAISGANSRTYTINGTDDLLYYIKVAATKDTCKVESAPILADGYAFGLPYLIAKFQPGSFVFIGNGEYNVCNGASVLLENGFDQVYGLHTWYRCVPSDLPPVPGDTCIIRGVTGDTYTATTSGFYGFWACTEYCPKLCLFLGLPSFIKLNFGNWSFCITSIDDPVNPKKLSLYPNPTTSLLILGKVENVPFKNLMILDMTGKVVLNIDQYDNSQPINVSHFPTGVYNIIATSKTGKIYRNKFVKK